MVDLFEPYEAIAQELYAAFMGSAASRYSYFPALLDVQNGLRVWTFEGIKRGFCCELTLPPEACKDSGSISTANWAQLLRVTSKSAREPPSSLGY